jgi:hypothetical protein
MFKGVKVLLLAKKNQNVRASGLALYTDVQESRGAEFP